MLIVIEESTCSEGGKYFFENIMFIENVVNSANVCFILWVYDLSIGNIVIYSIFDPC